MKVWLFLALIILPSLRAGAQELKWARGMGGKSSDAGYSIALDKNSNSYTTGYFEDTVDFDPGTGTYFMKARGRGDGFIQKLDSSGNFVWARSIGGDNSYIVCNALVWDNMGFIYVTGYFGGTVDFDPGSGIKNQRAVKRDLFILKLDLSGNFVWVRQVGNPSDYPTYITAGWSIAIDNAGNTYTSGFFQDSLDFDPGSGTAYLSARNDLCTFVLKLDSSGTFVWAKNFGGAGEKSKVTIDSKGNVYTTGLFYGYLDFDPGAATYYLAAAGGSQPDIFISKLDNSGKFLWARGMGGGGRDAGRSIAIDASGNVYTTGFHKGGDFDPGSGTAYLAGTGNANLFISKLSAAGNFIWAKGTVGNFEEAGFTLTLDKYGNPYASGEFRGRADFDPGSGTAYLNSAGAEDIFILKLDTAGKYIWAIGLGGTDTDWSEDIQVDNRGNIYATGIYSSGVDFDPGSGNYTLNSTGYEDIYIVKLCQPPVAEMIIGRRNVCAGDVVTFKLQSEMFGEQFVWTFPAGTTIISGKGTSVITVKFGSSSGTVEVKLANKCGNLSKSVNVSVHNLPKVGHKTEPASATVCKGSSVILSGTGALNYFWPDTIQDGKPFFPDSSRYYTVTGYDQFGCAGMDTAFITVVPIPVITEQPQDQTVNTGNSCLFKVRSQFTQKYQWQVDTGAGFRNLTDNALYSGSSGDSLFIRKVNRSSDQYRYRCVLSNGTCTDTSREAIINVNCILKILTEPSDTWCMAGTNVIFRVRVAGNDVQYRWQLDSGSGFKDLANKSPFSGVNDDTLKLDHIAVSRDGSRFRCVVSDDGCMDTTSTALLRVICPGIISGHPLSQSVFAGSKVYFFVTLKDPYAAVRWQSGSGGQFTDLSDTGRYSGSSKDTLAISEAWMHHDHLLFRCVASKEGCADTSETASILINCPVLIISQPADISAAVGSPVKFSVQAKSKTSKFLWEENPGTGYSRVYNNNQYSGAEKDTLYIKPVSTTLNGYRYRCHVSDYGCRDTSIGGVLTVKTIGIHPVSVKESEVTLWPNPASGILRVNIQPGIQGLEFGLYDSEGKLVLSGYLYPDESIIDLGGFRAGTYTLRISGNEKRSFRVIKE